MFITTNLEGQQNLSYQTPPPSILDLADAPPTPGVRIDAKGEVLLLLERRAYKSIRELAEAEFRLAGLRINPRNNGRSRMSYFHGIRILRIREGREVPVSGLPESPLIGNPFWSPDYSKVAFMLNKGNGIELWILDVESGKARALTSSYVSDVLWSSPDWSPDGKGLIFVRVDEDRGKPVTEKSIPTGPVIQENTGQKAPARTYQDLLRNEDDERLFDYFTRGDLVYVDLEGHETVLKEDEIFYLYDFSPNGDYILSYTIQRPYSYLVPYYRFPMRIEILDRLGKPVKTIAEIPSQEELPKGFDAVRKGPRRVRWRTDQPATLYYAEALDEGDPANVVDYRDALYTWKAPFQGEAMHLMNLENRVSRLQWGDDLAIVTDYWWKTRMSKVYQIQANTGNTAPKVIFELNTEDRYANPGSFLSHSDEDGYTRLLRDKKGNKLFITGEGYSPEGNRPFVDEYDLKSGETTRLWRASGDSTYERVYTLLDVNSGEALTSIEGPKRFPNFYLRDIRNPKAEPKQITFFNNPYAEFSQAQRELLHYQREDGVELTAQLYLPPGYNQEKDGPLPMLLWAYPREYKDSKSAGQVKESPHRFTRLYYGSPLFWVMRGYAVLDRTDFPVVGEGKDEPNDSFVEQLVTNAKAAIDKVAEMGVVDPERVAAGGHSYGAFMTANLLAHSDLFAAGIARSGAYNRTLTPFGFQAEERTLWEAPEVYFKMSPFMHADKIKEPILLIHGEADNNSGTYPMQSERFYNALKGHGAIARLVFLPHESHGYAARESIMHMLWEMDQWLEKYVKHKAATKEPVREDE